MLRQDDYIQQLADYIKKNINKGYTIESLKFSLMRQGYSRISVNKAAELVNEQLAAKAPAMKEKPQIVYKAYPNPDDFDKKGFFQKVFKFFS
jgi:hypothetical protein